MLYMANLVNYLLIEVKTRVKNICGRVMKHVNYVNND